MTITQSTDTAILNWQSFGIGAGETVTFHQPHTRSLVLNRVLGRDASAIYGHLEANGQVFLVNPNGVYFAPGAEVDVGGIVASTLGIGDSDFLGGKYRFSGDTGTGVRNAGTITARPGGYVAFLGSDVSNAGTIRVPGGTVALGAGAQVDLTLAGNSLLSFGVSSAALKAEARNGGLIQAEGGTVLLTAEARNALLDTVVNNTGVIRAQTAAKRGGVIQLLGEGGGTVAVAGTLDASAPNSGDGGRIETSGARVAVARSVDITTKAAQGKDGSWLIDPTDFTIAPSGGDISGAALSAALAHGDVTIQTVAAGTTCAGASCGAGKSGSGDVSVDDTVSWDKNTLTLSAYRDITINSEMKGSGTAGLALDYGQGTPDGTIGGVAADYTVNAPVDLAATGSFTTKLGSGGAPVRYTIIDSLGSAADATNAPAIMTLQGIANTANLGGNYVLGANIDASATSGWNASAGSSPTYAGFAPIGYFDYQWHDFTGIFAGLGHTVSGLTINRSGTDYVGLFGVADATIRDVGLLGGSITGQKYVGDLAGFNENGEIENAYATGNVVGLSSDVGGLVGRQDQPNGGSAVIRNSYASGNVKAWSGVGGLLGSNRTGTVMDAHATGTVTGSNVVGGLIGDDAGGSISKSYASGAVTGGSNLGGLIGDAHLFAAISDSYATGSVSSDPKRGNQLAVGGFVGDLQDSSIDRSYASGNVKGGAGTGGLIGVVTPDGGYAGSSVSNVYASGSVMGVGAEVGGLIGQDGGADVKNAAATGAVAGQDQVGGLIGSLGASPITLSNAYATGSVTATGGSEDSAGGLVGSNGGSISNVYATGEVTTNGDPSYVGGLVGMNSGSIQNAYWDSATASLGLGPAGNFGSTSQFTGLTVAQMHDVANFGGFIFTTTPGASGWVTVDTDGTLNNASGAAGGTLPMLAAEYATTVTNAHQLQLMAMAPGAGYTLGAAVDAGATGRATGARDIWLGGSFVPVGSSATPFTGSFEGNGYGIKGLTIALPKQDDVGLFGVLGASARVRNAHLTDVLVVGGADTGALAGRNAGGTVDFAYEVGSVTGTTNVGGLIGENGSTISNAYAAGGTKGTEAVGGLVGTNAGGTIGDAYAIDTVSAPAGAGALVGVNGGGAISGSFYDTTVNSGLSGAADLADSAGTVFGMATAEMQNQANFTGATAANGGKGPSWDFASVWAMLSGYPLLQTVPASYAPAAQVSNGGGGNGGSGGSGAKSGGSNGSGGTASEGNAGSGGAPQSSEALLQALAAQQQSIEGYRPPPPPPIGGAADISSGGVNGPGAGGGAPALSLDDVFQVGPLRYAPGNVHHGSYGPTVEHYRPANGQLAHPGAPNPVQQAFGVVGHALQQFGAGFLNMVGNTVPVVVGSQLMTTGTLKQVIGALDVQARGSLQDITRAVAAAGGGSLSMQDIATLYRKGGLRVPDTVGRVIAANKGRGGGLSAQVVSNLMGLSGQRLTALDLSHVIASGGGNLTLNDAAGVIASGGGNLALSATVATYVIASGGGNVIASGGGNVIAPGGGNVIASGGGNLVTLGDMAQVIASGGGNLSPLQMAMLMSDVKTGLIATHGGNVIASGGGNLAQVGAYVIASGGGKVIASGGGNLIATGGGNLSARQQIRQMAAQFFSGSGAGVIASGGGNVIASGGGNVIASGGGNVIASGGGN